MKKFLLLISVIFFILSLTRCVKDKGSMSDSACSSEEVEDVRVGNDLTVRAMHMADSVITSMTLEEMVGQCFMPSIYSRDDEETLRKLREYMTDLHVGGIILLKGNLLSAATMGNIGSKANVPLFVAIDAEWGLGMRLEDAPGFPKNGFIGPGADEQLLYDYGREVARECRRVGINMVLGPVIDVAENPDGVIGSRSFGNDPVKVADFGVAYARGLESGGVVSVAKHFPGHGSPEGDSHRILPVVNRNVEELDSIDIYPFKSYISSGLSGIMVGYLAVPAVDPECRPAAVSRRVVTDLLRGYLKFDGLVLTDALNMEGAEGYSADEAIKAGADIVVSPADTRLEIKKVIDMVISGGIEGSEIADRCRRILFYKYLLGLGRSSVSVEPSIREYVSIGTDSLSRRLSQ